MQLALLNEHTPAQLTLTQAWARDPRFKDALDQLRGVTPMKSGPFWEQLRKIAAPAVGIKERVDARFKTPAGERTRMRVNGQLARPRVNAAEILADEAAIKKLEKDPRWESACQQVRGEIPCEPGADWARIRRYAKLVCDHEAFMAEGIRKSGPIKAPRNPSDDAVWADCYNLNLGG